MLTVDTEYTVPLGTELRYITSCAYSDKSVQVSSSATYQRQLRETATSSSSVSKSGGSSRTNGSNFDIQAEVSVPISEVDVEAGGGGGRTWGDSKGSDFSDSLGAKTVLTSVITQDKLKELESQDIDISTSFNFKSMKSEANGENNSFNVNANVGGSVGGSGGNSVVINNYSNTTTETTQERQLSGKERSLQEISERLENTYEFNVGGLPAVGGNWKEWSRSVRENPMPISYDVSSLFL